MHSFYKDPEYWVPVTAPNVTAVGAGGGPVFIVSLASCLTLQWIERV